MAFVFVSHIVLKNSVVNIYLHAEKTGCLMSASCEYSPFFRWEQSHTDLLCQIIFGSGWCAMRSHWRWHALTQCLVRGGEDCLSKKFLSLFKSSSNLTHFFFYFLYFYLSEVNSCSGSGRSEDQVKFLSAFCSGANQKESIFSLSLKLTGLIFALLVCSLV